MLLLVKSVLSNFIFDNNSCLLLGLEYFLDEVKIEESSCLNNLVEVTTLQLFVHTLLISLCQHCSGGCLHICLYQLLKIRDVDIQRLGKTVQIELFVICC